MKLKTKENSVAVYFILAVVLLTYLYPREGKFRYQYTASKPWKYGLLTAPFDFPIYKPTAELERERDSVMKGFVPYFQLDAEVLTKKLAQLKQDLLTEDEFDQKKKYYNYLHNQLTQLYRAGIIGRNDKQTLDNNQLKLLNKRENNRVVEVPITEVYTVKSAYVYLSAHLPPQLSASFFSTLEVNKYLVENLQYDENTSNKVKEELLNQVSTAKGMVQAGERIVDRGVIVDAKTYQILQSLKTITESRLGSTQRQGWIIVGIAILIGGLFACFFLYLYLFRQQYYTHKKDVLFLLSTITSFILFTELAVSYSLFNVYIIPYMIVPILICTFFDTRTALFSLLTVILACSMMVPFPTEFLLLQIVGGMVVVFSLKDLTERSQLVKGSFFVLLAYTLFYFGLILFQEGDVSKIRWQMFMYFGINFIFLMFTYALIYLLEKSFGYLSNVSLVELSDINQPLLRQLSEVAPGTFQHSLQVSILAAAAADKIGANVQLTRTGALYHDIGKMQNPAYFTENQSGINPHDQLSYEESARIIIGHVMEGEKMARKNNLPQQIIDFIVTHHGKGKAKYFYHSFMNENPDSLVNEQAFSYPGPNPFSKETAVVMMADSIEAASHSLSDYTDETLGNLIEKMIKSQIDDGLLNNAPLTFKDIEVAKAVFNEKLRTMYHTRISYPELTKETEHAE